MVTSIQASRYDISRLLSLRIHFHRPCDVNSMTADEVYPYPTYIFQSYILTAELYFLFVNQRAVQNMKPMLGAAVRPWPLGHLVLPQSTSFPRQTFRCCWQRLHSMAQSQSLNCSSVAIAEQRLLLINQVPMRAFTDAF